MGVSAEEVTAHGDEDHGVRDVDALRGQIDSEQPAIGIDGDWRLLAADNLFAGITTSFWSTSRA